ncbi:MAG: response regulator [Bryobacterales bacterium]|nr:response regulator [Bryobacterales bacterium]
MLSSRVDLPVNQRWWIQATEETSVFCARRCRPYGLEAVHAACHESYAAILMDCQMPDMDGIEATRFIRSNADRIGRVPIVAVTAFGHEEDRLRCFDAGVDEFMVKPIRIEALAKVLAQWAPVNIEREAAPQPGAPPELRDHARQDIEQAISRLSADLDAELVHEVVALFVEDTRLRIDEVRKLSASQERALLRNAAHKIKGSCGSLGARALMSACERLEELAQSGSREQIEDQVERVAEQFKAIEPLMREFLDLAGGAELGR